MTNELYHYGVPGMKWGVRRSRERLGRKIDKHERKNTKQTQIMDKNARAAAVYKEKSAKYQAKNVRYQKKMVKASAKKAKYDRKLYKATRRGDSDRIGKYAAKSSRMDARIAKAKSKTTHNKWEIKAQSLQAKADNAKLKIEHNDRMQRMYKTTISAMDKGTVKQGKIFMQYQFAEQDKRYA